MGIKPRPFNSLGQIIQSGGVQAAATRLSLGESSEAVSARIQREFTGTPPEVREEIMRLAQEASDAAAEIAAEIGDISAEELIAAADLPANFPGVSPAYRFIVGRDAQGRFERQVQPGDTTDIFLGEAPQLPHGTYLWPPGIRGEIGLETTINQGESPLRLTLQLTGDETIDDMIERIMQEYNSILDYDPKWFEGKDVSGAIDLIVRDLYAVRKF